MSIVETAKKIIEKGKEIGDVELISQGLALLEENTEKNKYNDIVKFRCNHCEAEFESKPTRKACPRCKKRKLSLINNTVEQPVDDAQDGVTQTRLVSQQKGVPAKFRTNTFVDNGEYRKETKEQSKIIFNKTPRRPPTKMVQTTCKICGKTYECSPSLAEQTRCNNCIIK